MSELVPLTFEYWVRTGFRLERVLANYVTNNSDEYKSLVLFKGLSPNVVNEIKKAQSDTYDYMITETLLQKEKVLKNCYMTGSHEEFIRSEIARITSYIEQNAALFEEISTQKTIKQGAKFIIPEHYRAFIEKTELNAFEYQTAPYFDFWGNSVCYPTFEQMKYAQMDAEILWLKRLRNHKKNASHQKKLKDIFCEDEYYNFCVKLMKEYGVIDEQGKCLLNKKGFGYLHAIIDAVKTVTNPKLLVKDNFTDNELLSYFEAFLNRKIARIKRDKEAVMYTEKIKDARLQFRSLK